MSMRDVKCKGCGNDWRVHLYGYCYPCIQRALLKYEDLESELAQKDASLASAIGKQNAMDAEIRRLISELAQARQQLAGCDVHNLEMITDNDRLRSQLKLAVDALEYFVTNFEKDFCEKGRIRSLREITWKPLVSMWSMSMKALAAIKERE